MLMGINLRWRILLNWTVTVVTVTVKETVVEKKLWVLHEVKIGQICHGAVMKPDYGLLLARLVTAARERCRRVKPE
jgi:hypothetical protein